ncbi:arsenate-mycothiol transferase ArsC [Leucobacter aridicollis]|uniref:arsenate-mycothiol transferase ArsC n=1 Tax=Leucobacter aridicollis TaxID=283878 RepID=UPI000E64A749|nr:low molecular weight phosphatase family protein [Leucobacter aridicollis]UTX53919.1 low molecular weight phosphatase family protein [Leucobacter aridicollis]
MSEAPGVLFVCVKNGGKSQIAAGLMRALSAGKVRVDSAGTAPGNAVSALAAEVLRDRGIEIGSEVPTLLTDDAMRRAGLVVVLGAEANVAPVAGVRVETWHTDEPSTRGIDGRERMELVCDDIEQRVRALLETLSR